MIGLSGIALGFSGHYLDKLIVRISDQEWQLMVRYMVGGTLIFIQGLLIFRELQREHWRDYCIATGGGLFTIGAGVGMARMFRGLTE